MSAQFRARIRTSTPLNYAGRGGDHAGVVDAIVADPGVGVDVAAADRLCLGPGGVNRSGGPRRSAVTRAAACRSKMRGRSSPTSTLTC